MCVHYCNVRTLPTILYYANSSKSLVRIAVFNFHLSSDFKVQTSTNLDFMPTLCASNVFAGARSTFSSHYLTFVHEMFMTRPIILLIMEFKELVQLGNMQLCN